MSKKRGLSLEEKREKMLQIFYDSQDFYLLKELEKLGPKKGVISQSVKDVIQSLVDDDLVSKDKVGSSVYFWSLPSCAGNQMRSVQSKLESDLQSSKKRLAELIQQRDVFKKGREESDEREEALGELKTVETKYNELKNEMGKYADNDPAALEAMKNAIGVAHAAANRWTDNIFTLRQWCSNNFPQAKEQLEHLYAEAGITDDFDYLETVTVNPISTKMIEGDKKTSAYEIREDGAFVEILDTYGGKRPLGFLHISEMLHDVDDEEEMKKKKKISPLMRVSLGQQLTVKCIGYNPRGFFKLSSLKCTTPID